MWNECSSYVRKFSHILRSFIRDALQINNVVMVSINLKHSLSLVQYHFNVHAIKNLGCFDRNRKSENDCKPTWALTVINQFEAKTSALFGNIIITTFKALTLHDLALIFPWRPLRIDLLLSLDLARPNAAEKSFLAKRITKWGTYILFFVFWSLDNNKKQRLIPSVHKQIG